MWCQGVLCDLAAVWLTVELLLLRPNTRMCVIARVVSEGQVLLGA